MVNINRSNTKGNAPNNRRGPQAGSDRNSRGSGQAEGNKVFVSNIDFNCTHQDLKNVFKDVGDVAFVEMLKDVDQKPKGCAIIRFKNSNMAGEAVKMMNRFEFKGRKLVVKDERDVPPEKLINNERKRTRDGSFDRSQASPSGSSKKFAHGFELSSYERPMPSTSGTLNYGSTYELPSYETPQASLTSGSSKYGNTFGLSSQFLEALGIDGPLSNRVFVANLDYNVTEEMLREVFEIAGQVLEIELVKEDDGKSKGFGFIEFEHPVEAVQAISMLNGQLYRRRPMSVELTRKERKKKEAVLRLPEGLKSIGTGLGINGTPLKDVARTIETGNQSGLLGAMPSGIGPSSSLAIGNMGVNMGGLAQGMSSGMGSVLSSGLANNMQGAMSGGLMGSMGGHLTQSLTSELNPNLRQNVNSVLGLMERPAALPMGININPNPMRSLSDTVLSHQQPSTNFGITGAPQRNVIQISNLPADYTWKSLQNLCTPFGDVTYAKISSRGVGMVQFENETTARRAVDMLDNQRFERQYLETRLL